MQITARRALLATVVAAVVTTGFAATAPVALAAPASAPTGLAVTVSPAVSAATADVTVGFTAVHALPKGGTVTLTVPVTSTRSTFSGRLLDGSTDVGSCVAGALPVFTCTATSAVAAGAGLVAELDGVKNKATGTYTAKVKTSADATTATTTFTVLAAASVGSPDVVLSSALASATGVTYDVSFVASAGGALEPDLGSAAVVVLKTLPAGATATLLHGSSTVGSCTISSATVTCPVSSPVVAGSHLEVRVTGVKNPARGAYAATVHTTSDSVAAKPPYTIDSEVSQPKVVVTPTTAASALAQYAITFTTSSSGALAAGDFVALILPTSTGAIPTDSAVVVGGTTVGSCQAFGDESGICSLTAPIAASTPVTVYLHGLFSPTAGSKTLIVDTAADAYQRTSATYTITAAGTATVSGLTVGPSATAGALDSYAFTATTSSTGALASTAHSAVVVGFPAGTDVSAATGTVKKGSTAVASCAPSGSTTVTCPVTTSVVAGANLAVSIGGVHEGPAGSDVLTVSTTSDATPTTTAYALGAARAVTGGTVTTDPVEGSTTASYTVGFTTTGVGGLQPGGGVTVGLAAGTDLSAITDGVLRDVTSGVVVGTCPASTTTTLTCTTTKATAADDALRITFDGAQNPAAGAYTTTIATTSDTKPATFAYQVGPVPTVTLSTAQAHPGDTITVTVKHFAGSSTLKATDGGQTLTTSPASPKTGTGGGITFTTTVTSTGDQPLVVTDASGGTASAPLDVETHFPTIVATPASGASGQTFTCSGSDWPAGSTINVYVGGANVTNLSPDADGTWSRSCTVPTLPFETTVIAANDNEGHDVSAPFAVVGGVTPAATEVSAGAVLGLAAHSFHPGATLTATWDGVTLAPSQVADSAGRSAGWSITVPASTGTGAHTLAVADGQGASAQATITVYAPTLAISPSSAAPGTAATCSGTGWPAGENVNLFLGSANVLNLAATSAGSFSGGCTVPQIPSGTGAFAAHDGLVAVTGAFTLLPGLTLQNSAGSASTTTASPGSAVRVTATALHASTATTASFDGTTIPGATATNASGTTVFTATIPTGATAGSHTLAVSDGTVTASATVTVYVPAIAISPSSAAPGTAATCSGTGWPAGESVNLYISTVNVLNLATTSTGTFSGGCTVPQVPTGTGTFTATDQRSSNATGAFTLTAGLTVQNGSGSAVAAASPGASVRLVATALHASTATTATFDGTALTGAVATATNGTTSFTTTLPANATTGSHTIAVSDGSVTATTTITVYAPTVTAPASVAHGTTFTCAGSGWPTSAQLNVSLGSTNLVNPVSAADGTFSRTCTVPSSFAPGTYALLVHDAGGTVSATTTITVT